MSFMEVGYEQFFKSGFIGEVACEAPGVAVWLGAERGQLGVVKAGDAVARPFLLEVEQVGRVAHGNGVHEGARSWLVHGYDLFGSGWHGPKKKQRGTTSNRPEVLVYLYTGKEKPTPWRERFSSCLSVLQITSFQAETQSKTL